MSLIMAIDPGPDQTAWVCWDGEKIHNATIEPNQQVINMLRLCPDEMDVHIEMVACFGMAVGKSVFNTVFWVGRYWEAWVQRSLGSANLVYRMDVKMHLCRSARAKDANIRQALIDRFGEPGVKKSPGTLYGIKSHLWAALAIAVFAHDRRQLLGTPV